MVHAKKNSFGKISLLASSIAFALSSPINAAEKSVSKVFDTVVVVGEITNTEVTANELEKQQANNLSDIFRHVPSVSVGGSVGIAQKVYVRGMEDTMLNVSVDGAPQTGTLFHHTGRISVEPELLKSVEVQAGAGEATSGAGAIGGAIRFETKDIEDLLAPGQKFGGLIKGSTFSNDGEKGSVSLYGQLTENVGVIGSFSKTENDTLTDGDGDDIRGSESEKNLAFIKLNADISDNQTLSISAEKTSESGDFGQRANWFVGEDSTLFPMERDRATFVLNHTYSPNKLVNLETTVYHTTNDLLQDVYTRWGEYEGQTKSTGFDIRNKSHLGNHTITYGTDYRKDVVTSGYVDESVLTTWAWDPDIGTFREEGEVFGVYLQDHWQLTDKLLLSYGLRYDKYELDQTTYGDSTDSNGVSPNIGLSYDVSDNLTLTAGHAEALRGKEIGDAFTLEINPTSTSLDPDLDAETVTNTEVGLEYKTDKLSLTASAYKSKVNDVIQDQNGGGTYYENIGDLDSDGFELGAAYQFGKLELAASFSHNDPKLDGHVVEAYEDSAIGNVHGDTFSLKAKYKVSHQFELGWHFTHVDSVEDIEVLFHAVDLGWIDDTQTIDKEGYNVHDLYLRWTPNRYKKLAVDFTVQNLFNETYRAHSSVADYSSISGWEDVVGPYEAGRDLRLTMSYQF